MNSYDKVAYEGFIECDLHKICAHKTCILNRISVQVIFNICISTNNKSECDKSNFFKSKFYDSICNAY